MRVHVWVCVGVWVRVRVRLYAVCASVGIDHLVARSGDKRKDLHTLPTVTAQWHSAAQRSEAQHTCASPRPQSQRVECVRECSTRIGVPV